MAILLIFFFFLDFGFRHFLLLGLIGLSIGLDTVLLCEKRNCVLLLLPPVPKG